MCRDDEARLDGRASSERGRTSPCCCGRKPGPSDGHPQPSRTGDGRTTYRHRDRHPAIPAAATGGDGGDGGDGCFLIVQPSPSLYPSLSFNLLEEGKEPSPPSPAPAIPAIATDRTGDGWHGRPSPDRHHRHPTDTQPTRPIHRRRNASRRIGPRLARVTDGSPLRHPRSPSTSSRRRPSTDTEDERPTPTTRRPACIRRAWNAAGCHPDPGSVERAVPVVHHPHPREGRGEGAARRRLARMARWTTTGMIRCPRRTRSSCSTSSASACAIHPCAGVTGHSMRRPRASITTIRATRCASSR